MFSACPLNDIAWEWEVKLWIICCDRKVRIIFCRTLKEKVGPCWVWGLSYFIALLILCFNFLSISGLFWIWFLLVLLGVWTLFLVHLSFCELWKVQRFSSWLVANSWWLWRCCYSNSRFYKQSFWINLCGYQNIMFEASFYYLGHCWFVFPGVSAVCFLLSGAGFEEWLYFHCDSIPVLINAD